MTLFEFLMAIASVVVAIALTEIFGGWGNLLRLKIISRLDWLHLGWTIVVVLYAIQYWVGIWPYRDVEFTKIYQVWFLIFPTLAIVLVAFSITPDADPDVANGLELNLREYYLSRRGPIFIGMSTFVVMASLADWIILDTTYSLQNLVLVFTLIVILVLPAITKNIRIHTLVMLINLTYLVANGLGMMGDFIV